MSVPREWGDVVELVEHQPETLAAYFYRQAQELKQLVEEPAYESVF